MKIATTLLGMAICPPDGRAVDFASVTPTQNVGVLRVPTTADGQMPDDPRQVPQSLVNQVSMNDGRFQR